MTGAAGLSGGFRYRVGVLHGVSDRLWEENVQSSFERGEDRFTMKAVRSIYGHRVEFLRRVHLPVIGVKLDGMGQLLGFSMAGVVLGKQH